MLAFVQIGKMFAIALIVALVLAHFLSWLTAATLGLIVLYVLFVLVG